MEDKENQLATIPTGNRGVVLSNVDDMMRFAEGIVKSGLKPKSFDTSAKIVIAIQTGLELGIEPMQALQGLHVINGKVGLSGDIAVALIQASGKALVFRRFFEGEEGTDEYKAVVVSKRIGSEDEDRTEFSIADAKTAKLWEKAGPWTQYWKRMLMYRAIGFHSRDYFGDVTKGMVVSEELNDYPVHDKPNCVTPRRGERKPVEAVTLGSTDGSAPETATEGGGADNDTVGVMLKGCINKFKDKLESIHGEVIPIEELLKKFRQVCWDTFGGEISQYAEPEHFSLEMIGTLNAVFDQEIVDVEPEQEETADFAELEAEAKAEKEAMQAEAGAVDKTPENDHTVTPTVEEPELSEAEVEAESKKKFGDQWAWKCNKCKEMFNEPKGTAKKPICPECLGSDIEKLEVKEDV